MADPRIKLLSHSHNQNGAAARNTGIQHASGQYICFLDSDDEWQPNKLMRVKQTIEENSRFSSTLLIHHQYANIEAGKSGPAFPNHAMSPLESVAHYSFVTNNVGGIQSSTICVASKIANSVRFNESLRGHQDWDFCLRAEKEGGHFVFIPGILTLRHRDHAGGVASSLDWRYSLNFYYLYKDYFDKKSAAYYFVRVVLKKALRDNSLKDIWFTTLFFRALLSQPKLLLSSIYNFYRKQRKLQNRVEKVYQTCHKLQARKLVVWGANNYGKALINGKPDDCEINLILDAAANDENNRFMNVMMLSIHFAGKKHLSEVDAIVLATDKHQQIMRNELSRLDNSLLKKIINF
jgi:glycosyltransferase involved in cell wall biosynthesis